MIVEWISFGGIDWESLELAVHRGVFGGSDSAFRRHSPKELLTLIDRLEYLGKLK